MSNDEEAKRLGKLYRYLMERRRKRLDAIELIIDFDLIPMTKPENA